MIVSEPILSSNLSCQADQGFHKWLDRFNVSLALSTYQSDRLLFVSKSLGEGDANQLLRITAREMKRPMGLFVDGGKLVVACKDSVWLFVDYIQGQALNKEDDAWFAPSSIHITGSIDAHEIVIRSSDNNISFANTQYSCISSLSEYNSFTVDWLPPFLQGLSGDDRCHLNGICLQNGSIHAVSLCGQLDAPFGWRKSRSNGGAIVDIRTGEFLASQLSMPHSPRCFRGNIWALESGKGYLGFIKDKQLKPVCGLPGFARGLAMIDDYAIVGISKLRSKSFKGLDIEKILDQGKSKGGACGLCIINLKSGKMEHYLFFEEPITEIFDVQLLPFCSPRLLTGGIESLAQFAKIPGRSPSVRARLNINA